MFPPFDSQNDPTYNALLGTLLTWGLTALGASLVFLIPKGEHRSLLDGSLGFAGGVMVAASYWSLLAPCIEKSEQLKYEWTWFPAAVGFALGGFGIALAEKFLPENAADVRNALEMNNSTTQNSKKKSSSNNSSPTSKRRSKTPKSDARKRRGKKSSDKEEDEKTARVGKKDGSMSSKRIRSFKRIMLLVVAITVHNFPEGLAVGVGFGSVGTEGGMTLNDAIVLAWGIGLQNFPEGLAVSLPLYREGMPMWKSFMWGQASGMVEPIAGVLGAILIKYANPVLPYALSFAAGAMIYVVVDDLIPEVSESGNTKYSSVGFMVGFIVMMVMDVALG
eukprot:g4817.t1